MSKHSTSHFILHLQRWPSLREVAVDSVAIEVDVEVAVEAEIVDEAELEVDEVGARASILKTAKADIV